MPWNFVSPGSFPTPLGPWASTRSTTLDEPRVWWVTNDLRNHGSLGTTLKHWVLHHIHPYIHLFTYNVYIWTRIYQKNIHHKFEWILILSTPQKNKTALFESGSFPKKNIVFSPPTLKKNNSSAKSSMSSSKQELFASQTRFFELGVCTWTHGFVSGQWMRTKCEKKT